MSINLSKDDIKEIADEVARLLRDPQYKVKTASSDSKKNPPDDVSGGISQQLGKLTEQYEAMSNRMDKQYRAMIKRMDKQYEAMSNRMDKQYEAMSNRMDKQYEAMSNRMDNMERYLYGRLDELESRYSGLDAGITTLIQTGGPRGRGLVNVLMDADRSTINERFVLGSYRDRLP